MHITFNPLVNNQRNIFMTGRSGGLGAGNMVIAYNIIQGGGMGRGLQLATITVESGSREWTPTDRAVPFLRPAHADPKISTPFPFMT